MKKILLALLLLHSTILISGTIKGKITNKSTGETIANVDLIVEKDGLQYAKSHTDFYGKYSIKGLIPGTYTLHISYEGMEGETVENIVVVDGRYIYIDLALETKTENEETKKTKAPLINKDHTYNSTLFHKKIESSHIYARRIPAVKMVKVRKS